MSLSRTQSRHLHTWAKAEGGMASHVHRSAFEEDAANFGALQPKEAVLRLLEKPSTAWHLQMSPFPVLGLHFSSRERLLTCMVVSPCWLPSWWLSWSSASLTVHCEWSDFGEEWNCMLSNHGRIPARTLQLLILPKNLCCPWQVSLLSLLHLLRSYLITLLERESHQQLALL